MPHSLAGNDQISPPETNHLTDLAMQCLGVDGDFVELGCYRGDTSVLFGRLLQKSPHNPKTLWIYDSFAGLPEKSPQDNSGAGAHFQPGELLVSKREVVDKLRRAGLHDVRVKKAWFSDLTPQDLPAHIAFAFIDGDFYESQRDGLRLVAPKLTPRGLIVCHDYNNPELPGASRAVDEFLSNHPTFQLQIFHSLAILRQVR